MAADGPKRPVAADIQRGDYTDDVPGTLTFFLSRLADPYLQYGILSKSYGASLIRRLGGRPLPQGPPLITRSPLDHLGLSPYRTILFGMSVGSMLKQNYWLTVTRKERMPPALGLMVGIFNAAFNSINTLLFVCAETSASTNGEHFPQTPLQLGTTLYVLGLGIEWWSEQQRHSWKKDPANNEVYSNGLFGLSRHINYFGYTLWRVGYALAGGGWVWAGVTGALFSTQFLMSTIPDHQKYMEQKYGDKFMAYEQRTPSKFIPWLL
ncbi:hypothetical protein Slin15195_G048400 [Septoria linicola]|uniref:Steroid 5-alpha reductase C-terminal domain-containing protein n=1 Tax=Septoria linicola TaxID=215465 RepID=A0A9Q9AVM4_9PEZI|nr:hypothetical protein Slin14017_G051970 [Septoria linicola]USW51521.1 hypothetical protein Slin15195_G048400 [Septoria linicola]